MIIDKKNTIVLIFYGSSNSPPYNIVAISISGYLVKKIVIFDFVAQPSIHHHHHCNLCPPPPSNCSTLLSISSCSPHVFPSPLPRTCTVMRALMPRSALLVAPRGRTGRQGKLVQPTPMGKTARLGPALTQAASPYSTTLSLSIRLRRKESRKRLI